MHKQGDTEDSPQFEDVIISLKSAQNKGTDPYALDETKPSYHDTLNSLRLDLCCMRQKNSHQR